MDRKSFRSSPLPPVVLTSNLPQRPRPNSRVTSRQISAGGDAEMSAPESLEAAACNSCVMDRVFRVSMPEIILDQTEIISPVGEVKAA